MRKIMASSSRRRGAGALRPPTPVPVPEAKSMRVAANLRAGSGITESARRAADARAPRVAATAGEAVDLIMREPVTLG